MDDLIQKRNTIFHNIEIKIKTHEKELALMLFERDKINNQIYNSCDHNWIKDRPYTYDKGETYCSKCNMYRK